MKTITSVVSLRNKRSQQSHCAQDAEINLQENSTVSYPQSEELFSKDADYLKKEVALSQIDLSRFPDGTQVLQVDPQLILDIPDCFFEESQDLHYNKKLQKSYIGYLSEEHRKEQLVYLNGK